MTYFAALVTRADGAWDAREVDVGELADPEAVADLLRDAAKPGEPAVLLVEREDEWFALARCVDDELEVFVSDVYGAAHSSLGDVLVPTGDGDVPDDEPRGEGEDGASVSVAVPGGDGDLLADLGVDEAALLEICDDEHLLPGDALSAVAERAGFADVYDGLR